MSWYFGHFHLAREGKGGSPVVFHTCAVGGYNMSFSKVSW